MSQESISFFEDKTVEQIINWMIAHLSEAQLRACLNSAGITPEYSAGPSSSATGQRPSAAGPSSSGAGSSSDPLPMPMPMPMPQIPPFTPPPAAVPRQLPTFDISPYIDNEIETRQIIPLTQQDMNALIKYVGYQVESKEDIRRVFPNVDAIGLSAIPVYIYGYSAPYVYFIGFLNSPGGLYVTPFRAPTLKIFKQIGFELLRTLDSSVTNGQYTLKPGLTITKEMQKAAKTYGVLKSKEGIMTNTLQILNPGYITDVVRPFIAAQKAAKFGVTENYNGITEDYNSGYIFDDLTVDDFNFNDFGEQYENENENETEMNYGNETEMNYENENGNETEMNYENENGNENENENEMNSESDLGENVTETKSNMRVYDMNPEQLYQHMINKFGSKFANEYTAEKYVNSNGVPAVKYIKGSKNSSTGENENEINSELNSETNSQINGPIISGFGEESDEEENLF